MGVPEGEEREKGPENISEDIIAENFPNLGENNNNNNHSSPGSAESPIQDEPKQEHAKTHCN